ncbi:Alpha-N-acetylgalactosaminidase [Planctomycetales bacterium 10988]|nr:Alpha-N-acetylgalactosaminidase [Planctomycetales bacterium 10988]
MNNFSTNRRHFIKSTLTGVAAASSSGFFSIQRSLADELKSPNERMTVGLIGSGGIARSNMNSSKQWLKIVAIADVDKGRREEFNARYALGKATLTEDYREVIERDDVDVIHVATPDHWHTKPVIEAMLAGKDVYCEKPLTLTIDEGKLIRKVQKETGRVVQVGTQQRSQFDLFVKAMAIVAEGRLGRIQQVQAAIGAAPSCPSLPVSQTPSGLNFDRWLGPAPKVDYRQLIDDQGESLSNCHYTFRWWYEYSGGKLTDWGAHHVDICNWALKLNGQTEGPTSIEGVATHPVKFENGYPVQKDRFNTATEFKFVVKYPNGTEMIIRHDTDNGVLITGEKGRIFVNRKKLVGKPVENLKHNPLPEDAIAKVYRNFPMEENNARTAHWGNFLHCVRERKLPISDVHSHMEMLNICHLAGISARFARPLKWDPVTETILEDEEANSFLSRPYRQGYEIEM